MLRGNIAATLLKMLLKNLYSEKCYDKLNINVLTLSLWENFWWGLIYFDQFTKSISKIFILNFVCVLTNERYKTYQTGFSFCRLGHALEMGLGGI